MLPMPSLATVTWDIEALVTDMVVKGWLARNLARPDGVSDMTVSRFLRGERQTARTAWKLARALSYSPKRYLGRAA